MSSNEKVVVVVDNLHPKQARLRDAKARLVSAAVVACHPVSTHLALVILVALSIVFIPLVVVNGLGNGLSSGLLERSYRQLRLCI